MSKKFVFLAIRAVITRIELLLVSVYFFLFVAANFRKFRSYQNIVIHLEGGFGHTVLRVDICRRLWAGKRNCIIFLDKKDVYNKYIKYIWNDIDVVFLPIFISRYYKELRGVGTLSFNQRIGLGSLFKTALNAFLNTSNIIDIHGLKLSTSDNIASAYFEAAYTQLWSENPLPSPRLPSSLRGSVYEKLGLAPGGKFCGLYLRHENKGPIQYRNGADLDEYGPAIEWLVEQGFTILVTGHRRVDSHWLKRFPGRIGDAGTWGVEPGLFSMFAATEPRLFIVEPGGGMWLPALTGKPVLMVNQFPPGQAMPGATILYKHLIRQDGSELSIAEGLRRFNAVEEDLGQYGITPVNCSPEELLAAIQEFVQFSQGDLPAERLPSDVQAVCDEQADHSMLARARGARLSPIALNHAMPQPSTRAESGGPVAGSTL